MAWRVNQSPDGRFAVAALGDSTIRWYRADTGAELLALYVTEDAKRWVAFTPAGYYAASPGGEDLIGWHVNRGPDKAADFFAASRFRDRFYRPDIVARVLASLGETAAPARLSRDALPPIVTILDPSDGAPVQGDFVRLRYRLRSPSGRPVTALKALVNGQLPPLALAPTVPAIPGPDREVDGTLDVSIPAGETAIVSLAAITDREGAPARIQVTSTARKRDYSKPRLRGVLVGVANYPRKEMKLGFADKDARDIAKVFTRQDEPGARYSEVALTVLPNEKASRTAVLTALQELRAGSRDDDISLVFLSGHGMQHDGRTFFLPADADPLKPDVTAISKPDLIDLLSRIRGRVVVMLDICHAGAFTSGLGPEGMPDLTLLASDLRDKPGLVIFASSGRGQPSEEVAPSQNGAFTAAVLSGLAGAAAMRDNLVSIEDLDAYVTFEVRRLTQGRQAAKMVRNPDVRDFPLYATLR
jgi:hypothetical protein